MRAHNLHNLSEENAIKLASALPAPPSLAAGGIGDGSRVADIASFPRELTISALVCTRNRGISIVPTVRSILACTHPQFTLIVIDQSENEETKEALKPFLSDTRLRYLPSKTQGLGKARNLGLAQADTDLVAMTDDDCEVPPEWLTKIAEAFQQQPKVAVLFCNVSAIPYDSAAGFIPVYESKGNRLVSTLRDKCTARGIGAGLAVRREPVCAIGGFDEMLGVGAAFPSCEDGDMAVRALLKGWQVFETDSVTVLHSGFRRWDQGREMARRDWLGIGAAYSKPLRTGNFRFLMIPAYEFFVYALRPTLSDLFRRGKLRNFTRIVYFFRGFWRGLWTPIDREKLVFRPKQ